MCLIVTSPLWHLDNAYKLYLIGESAQIKDGNTILTNPAECNQTDQLIIILLHNSPPLPHFFLSSFLPFYFLFVYILFYFEIPNNYKRDPPDSIWSSWEPIQRILKRLNKNGFHEHLFSFNCGCLTSTVRFSSPPLTDFVFFSCCKLHFFSSYLRVSSASCRFSDLFDDET